MKSIWRAAPVLCLALAAWACSDSPADPSSSPDAPIASRPDGGLPRGQLAYVATFLGGLHGYTVDSTTGALDEVPGSPVVPGAGLFALTADPSGDKLYAVDTNANALLGFAIGADGTLSALAHFPVTTSAGPLNLAVDPQRRFLYVGGSDPDASLEVFAMEANGTLTVTERSPVALHAAAATIVPSPDGRFVYVQAGGLHAFAVDGQTGALTELEGSPQAGIFRGALLLHPNHRFLIQAGDGIRVFAIDAESGKLTPVEGSPFTADVDSDAEARVAALDPTGRFLYATSFSKSRLSAFRVDAETGALTPVSGSPFDGRPSPFSVSVDGTGKLLYVGNDDNDAITLFAIDGAGVPTKVGDPIAVHGLQPEILLLPRP